METVLLVIAVVLLVLLLILVFSLASGTREKLAQQQSSVASLQQQLEAIRTASDGYPKCPSGFASERPVHPDPKSCNPPPIR